MDNASVWEKFVKSWKNENPNRNKKTGAESIRRDGNGGWLPEPGAPSKPVGTNYKKRMIADLRVVLKFAVSREKLSDNWASEEHGMKTTPVIKQKEPFLRYELDYIFRAASFVTDGRKRTGQQNAIEDLTFASALYCTGLRISDCEQLEISQLVEFACEEYSHAIHCNPQKTDQKDLNFVHIPIPNANFQEVGLPDLVSALKALPLRHGKYFFLGGGRLPEKFTPTGELTTEWKNRLRQAATRRRGRITRLFEIAARLMEADGKHFAHHPHPHRFRHTFAVYWLKKGLGEERVAQLLGITVEKLRKHYAKYCVESQTEMGRNMARVMFGKG